MRSVNIMWFVVPAVLLVVGVFGQETYDYRFGEECGEPMECGNATFDAYRDVRMVVLLVFGGAVVAKAVMTWVFKREGGLRELVGFSALVGLFLAAWPMMWDWLAAGVGGPIETGVGVSVVSAVMLAMLPLVFPALVVRAAVAR